MRRRLTLTHGGKVFLDRFGLEFERFGIYIHHIVDEDPGLDLHDHPWRFATLILRGGYVEEYGEARHRGHRRYVRKWMAGSIHYMGDGDAHRIIFAHPGTWTLVIRGRKYRPWGFFQPEGWVDQRDYDYELRRPVKEKRNHAPTSPR